MWIRICFPPRSLSRVKFTREKLNMQVWRNWQTRMVQVHVKAISCRFKSCYLHQMKNPVFRLKTAWILGFSHLYALFSVSQKCLKSPQKPLSFASSSTKYNTKAHVQRTGPLFSFLQKNLLSVNRKLRILYYLFYAAIKDSGTKIL